MLGIEETFHLQYTDSKTIIFLFIICNKDIYEFKTKTGICNRTQKP